MKAMLYVYLKEYIKIYPSFDIFPPIWIKFPTGYVKNNLLSHGEFPKNTAQSKQCLYKYLMHK
jgi:hypothetical protein